MQVSRRKSIELYADEDFTIIPTPQGTKIRGRLAYPGISKNRKLYTIDQLMAGHDKDLPVWLNHADTIGIADVGPDLLPDEYRQKLLDGEVVILGNTHLTFKPETLELLYEATITDPFYKNPEVLKRMSVSQGVLHPRDLPTICDTITCYTIIKDCEYEEQSLVFHPGFSIATLSTESVDGSNPFNLQSLLQSIMSQEDANSKKGKAVEAECPDCKKKAEEMQADGVMGEAGNCPEGQTWDTTAGKCIPEDQSGNPITNAAGAPNAVAGEGTGSDADGRTIGMFGAVEKAHETLKKSEEAVTKAKEALEKAAKEMEDKAHKDEEDDDDDDDSSKEGDDGEKLPWFPNADAGSRKKAQEAYNKKREEHYKAMEAMTIAASAATKATMAFAKENAKKQALVSSNTEFALRKKSIESAVMNPKAWFDGLIKSPENTPWNKTWKMTPEYIDTFTVKKFKTVEGTFLTPKYIPYAQHMEKVKSEEATNVAMAGGTDPNNFQRTLSELVLVYPDGIIVTPVQQFCETAILPPGKKEHLFYDVNVPDFADTDEANMDAGGGGYALVADDVTINASGGKTKAQGGLVRIGFTQLEEFPIDLIQKINIGFAMRAEERKNFEVINTAYNTDTAYAPATDAIRPKGGGSKTALDTQGHSHWVNGNTGVEITTDDTAATAALKFVGLLNAKLTIADTGLNVENTIVYLNYGGILQLLKDTDITTYTQRAVPEVITEGYIEKIAGVQLIASSAPAAGLGTGTKRAVMFLPVVSFGFVTGRELQVDAERVARQQSVFSSASLKMAGFVKRLESTCRVSFKPTA